MITTNRIPRWTFVPFFAAMLIVSSGSLQSAESPAGGAAVIRINAGASSTITDADGHLWLADEGFTGGDTIDRGTISIGNTNNPAMYRTERYSMTGFSRAVPNGKYVVKLHFAETFEEISGPKQRIFSFNVEGKEFKDFDVCEKAGGPQKAYVETVEVEVADGKLDIAFTSSVENPEINGIEIIPAN
jgi:endoglucanase